MHGRELKGLRMSRYEKIAVNKKGLEINYPSHP